MLVSGPVCRVLMVLLGYALPAYQTHKAVASQNSDQICRWCTYWLLIGFFLCIEGVADQTIYWLPLYYEAKLLLVLFMWHPSTQGSTIVYDKYMRPLLASNEARIDSTVELAKARIMDTAMSQVERVKGLLHHNTGATRALLDGLRTFSESRPLVQTKED